MVFPFLLKGSKAAEHGTEYADDEENNQDAASQDGEPASQDGEPASQDGEPASQDGEPKGEFFPLSEESTTKEMVEPKQADTANVKSGCTMPQDIDRHMSEGRPIHFHTLMSQSNLSLNSYKA